MESMTTGIYEERPCEAAARRAIRRENALAFLEMVAGSLLLPLMLWALVAAAGISCGSNDLCTRSFVAAAEWMFGEAR